MDKENEVCAAVEKKKGFAALSKEQRSAIARSGGKAAHAKGTAHMFTSEEGKAAGAQSQKNRPRFELVSEYKSAKGATIKGYSLIDGKIKATKTKSKVYTIGAHRVELKAHPELDNIWYGVAGDIEFLINT